MSWLADAGHMNGDVDDVFGEDFAYQPYAASRDTSAPETIDSARAAATIRALFSERPAKPLEHAWDGRQTRRPGVESGGPVIEISLAQQWLAAQGGSPLAIAVGDRFTRPLTGAVYRVTAIEPVTPTGLMKLKVNQL